MGIRTLRSHWDVISGSLRSAQQAVSSPKQSDNEVEAVLLKAGPSSEDAGPCLEDAGPSLEMLVLLWRMLVLVRRMLVLLQALSCSRPRCRQCSGKRGVILVPSTPEPVLKNHLTPNKLWCNLVA